MTPSKELLDRILAEEAELIFDRFDEDDAWRLGNLIVEEARQRKAPVAIDIRRPAQVLFHCALPGAAPDNEEWIRRKANLAFRMGRSSFSVGLNLALTKATLEDKHYISSLEFSAHGGAVPIRVAHVGIVACAVVSGLPQEEDHALVVACLKKMQAKD